jgi:hypothetical protein
MSTFFLPKVNWPCRENDNSPPSSVEVKLYTSVPLLWLHGVGRVNLTASLKAYNRSTSKKSPTICMTTFSTSLTNLTALPRQQHDSSYYVIRWILTSPPLWLQKHTHVGTHKFAHPLNGWHQPRLANFTCALSWRHCGIILVNNSGICEMNWAWFKAFAVFRI